MRILLSVVILVLANAIAIGVLLFIRRGAPQGSYYSDGDRASGVFGVLATGFSIFAGFVVFLAFSSYDQSRSGADTEAVAVAQQFETARFMPSSSRAALGGELVCYARTVVHQEWPRMEAGSEGDAPNPWGIALYRTLKRIDPQSTVEQAAYSKWLDQTSDREEARLDRVHGAAGIIPGSIWIVLFVIAAVVFAFMLFFADSAERRRSQAMLIGSATTVIVITLLAIHALDSPYSGDVGSIEPTAMQRTLRILAAERAILGDRSTLPCDASGTASGS